MKKESIERFQDSENEYPVLIHPNVIYSHLVDIGEGTIICVGSILTVNINIGKHVIINLDCTIGHYSTILPSVSISGAVGIGECTSVGTSSVIIQGVNSGEGTIVGAPAKPIKFHNIKSLLIECFFDLAR